MTANRLRFWTTGPNWPKNGEIDIIEGVNDQENNGMTLHTGPGCQIGENTGTQFAGKITTGNCDVAAKGQGKNVGCSIEHPSTSSYGAGLNAIGGGVYATQWTSEAISVYFFPRDSIPEDVLGDSPDPSGWGKPAAKFTGGCDIENTFKQQKVVFDTTFCGLWAGSSDVWESGSCGKKAATCEEWVQNNPEAFAEAYWTVNALKVYQDNGDAAAPEPVPAPEQSSAVSVPVPVPTSEDSLPTEEPSAPEVSAYPTSLITPSVSGIFAPIPTSETLSKASSVPAAPIPTSETLSKVAPLPTDAAPSVPVETPSATLTQDAPSSDAPTTQIAAPAPAPSGPMSGFNWPVAGAKQPDDAPPATTSAVSPPENSQVPPQSPVEPIAAPSTTQNTVVPSAPIAPKELAPAPTNAGDAPPAVPVVTDIVQEVRTVYNTIYTTVTAGAEETPAPAARKARMARFAREHRQRLTKHHARR
jgi:hypothetical protein